MAGTPQSAVGVGTATAGCAVCPKSGSALPGTRNVSLRAEIDTSPPFGSVKEAVTHFESSGAWIHLHKLGIGEAYMNNIGEIDIKRVEEQTLELEKNLIVKELETLDVLEELGTTKRMVEDLKWQLQKEALKSMTAANTEDHHHHHHHHQVMTPDIREINQLYIMNNNQDKVMASSSPCPVSSPDLILMELNQAKLNLGKTINELGSIQTSVETLNKKIRKERSLLEKTRHRLTLKSAPRPMNDQEVSVFEDHAADVQEIPMNEHPKNVAEMKLVAAKKMEEAARAAEAVAIAEIKALSGSGCSFDYPLPEPDNAMFSKCQSPLFSKKMPKLQIDGANYFSRVAILKKMEDAEKEVNLSKQAMEEALQRMEIASRKQLDAGEALRRWNPRCHNPRPNRSNPPEHTNSPLINLNSRGDAANDEPKPVLRTTVSMRDILSRKQSLPDHHEDYAPTQIGVGGGGQNEGRKVALSQMLNELREDIRFPTRSDGNSNTHQKQFISQRKKFGFIHISLPLARPNRKNLQPSTGMR